MHPDIADHVRVHVDATTNQVTEQPRVMQSDVTSWHGLMVAAIGSGNGSASGGVYRGIASESDLVLIKVSNSNGEIGNLNGQVKEADILRGCKWLLQAHKRFNVRIVNISVGGDRVSNDAAHSLHVCVRQLTEAGIVVVIAAGNRGEKRLVPPASSPHGIVIGGYNDNNSLDRADWTGYHSNYGTAFDGTTKPDIIAPAQWIASPILPDTDVAKQAQWLGPLLQDTSGTALRTLLSDGCEALDIPKPTTRRLGKALHQTLQERIHAHKLINEGYQHVDGTSVAAPIVSSVIAQMLEANPTLSPEQIRTILKNTAIPVDGIPQEQQGAGAISARAALLAALQWQNTPESI